MKAILLIVLMLTGCASVSDYNQGCRDGVKAVGLNKDVYEPLCNGLDHSREQEKHQGKRT